MYGGRRYDITLSMEWDWASIGNESTAQLQRLLQFRTVNPPGNEGPCAEYVMAQLKHPLIECVRLDCEGRPNVVARLRGSGAAEPLLLTGHIDVVPVEAERWSADPFGGEIRGDHLYGRGALDMKSMVSMCISVMRLLAEEDAPRSRDLILAVVSDEETGCEHGSRFLVEQHPESVRAGCLIGEFGGFSMNVQGQRIYPIQVAEKGLARLTLIASGAPGHGSVPHQNMAVAHLSEGIHRIASGSLPVHPTATVRAFLDGLARTQGFPASWVLRKLAWPTLSDWLRRTLIRDPAQQASFKAMLQNTVSPTLLAAGNKVNVIPGEAQVTCDGRILPGQTAEDLQREIQQVLRGLPIEVRIDEARPGRENSGESALFSLMARAIRAADPEGHPLPYLLPGYTDSSQFSRLGMDCFGFCPLKMPADEPFWDLVHGHDERIYLPAYRWGLPVLHSVVREWCLAK